jgi:hypothetical protein
MVLEILGMVCLSVFDCDPLPDSRKRRFPGRLGDDATAAGLQAAKVETWLLDYILVVIRVVQQIKDGMSAKDFAKDFELPDAQVQAALAYAEAFPDEIEADLDRARDHREWIQQQDAAWRAGHRAKTKSPAKAKGNGKGRQ